MRAFIAPLGALLICLSACGSAVRNLPRGYARNESVVVMVREIGIGMGTGTVVDKNGIILTNYHVISSAPHTVEKDGKEVTVKGSGKFEVCQIVDNIETCSPAEVVAKDVSLDLALLTTKSKYPRQLVFAEDSTLKRFDKVYAWANVGYILPTSPFEGRYINRVSPTMVEFVKREMLVFDISMNPGGSGSPIFDMEGRCVGIVTGVTPPPGRSLTIAVPSSEVIKFLKKNGITIKRVLYLHN